MIPFIKRLLNDQAFFLHAVGILINVAQVVLISDPVINAAILAATGGVSLASIRQVKK